MIRLVLSDLIHINNAARAFKQANVIWLQDKLFGLDNYNNYITICVLDRSELSILPLKGLMFNQRELAKFMKNISTESEFFIDDSNQIMNKTLLTTSLTNDTLSVTQSMELNMIVTNNWSKVVSIENRIADNDLRQQDVTNELEKLFKMSKSTGAFIYKHDKDHMLTLFSGIIPLNKADKVYLTLLDNPDNTFLARFRVSKKKFDVYAYLMYLKI